MTRPIRHRNHVLEEMSKNFFLQHLPPEWTRQEYHPDYGKDYLIGIVEEGEVTNLNFIVQLKSSQTSSRKDEFETIRLSMSQYNHLNDDLYVVLLIKFVQSEMEGYWQLLYNIRPPDREQRSFSVPIPKVNRLSLINWNTVRQHVWNVTHDKLEARR
jgi:hypothetical protein